MFFKNYILICTIILTIICNFMFIYDWAMILIKLTSKNFWNICYVHKIDESTEVEVRKHTPFSKIMDTTIQIDGSILEGGGQILRNAFSFSVLTKTPIEITKIRAGRDKPGLMEQHLKGLQLVQAICNGNSEGAEKGSTNVKFLPDAIQGGNFTSIVKTAGSISLVLQVALPCILFANTKVELFLEGGTNAEMAPQIDYMTEVFRPNLEKMGATFSFDLLKRGYFPKGGGRVKIVVDPVTELKPLILEEFGTVTSIYGWSFVAGRKHIREAYAMADGAKAMLKSMNSKVSIECYYETREIAPVGDCAGIIIVAETSTGCILGGSALMRRGESPQDAGKRAGEELLNTLKLQVCVDNHIQDQMIIFMALANGKSKIKTGELTLHTKTAIHIAELLTKAKFQVQNHGEYNILECDGIAYKR